MDIHTHHNVDIEQVKEYWNRRPCNIRHSDLSFGTKEYFDAVEARRYKVEPHTYKFAEFHKWAGKKVLEIGCGIGTDAINFARAGADYHGFELSEKSLEITKQRFEVYDLPGTFYLGDAEQLEQTVPLQSFDLIYSFGVIHHAPNPANVVSQIPKYCDHNTRLKVMLYAKNSWKNILIESGYAQPEAQENCPQAVTYTKEEVVDLFNKFDISIDQDFIFPWKIDDYVQYRFVKEPWFESMSDELFGILEKKLGWNLLINGSLKKPKS
jgi:2-polyprenyl-3-methyl-5-hydroxy-6-metoxy-1,4-benzoquinol methylase